MRGTGSRARLAWQASTTAEEDHDVDHSQPANRHHSRAAHRVLGRPRRLGRMYRLIFVPDHVGYGEASTVGDYSGVALWTPPGEGKLGPMETLRLTPTVARIFGRWTPRALRGLSYQESKYPERPHYHLVFIGVEPQRQGRGIGSQLMRPVLRRFDREGVPVYLEASTPRSRALYLRHGFEDLDVMRFPGGGPPVWRVWGEA